MELMTPKEVARMLKISVSKCYELKERIGFLRIGGSIRFRTDAVVRFLEGCEENGKSQRKAATPRLRYLRLP